MRFDEQVLLHDERREGNEILAIGHFVFRLVESEDEHAFERFGDFGNFVQFGFNNTVGHKVAPSFAVSSIRKV